jgi:hypothetical protein
VIGYDLKHAAELAEYFENRACERCAAFFSSRVVATGRSRAFAGPSKAQ